MEFLESVRPSVPVLITVLIVLASLSTILIARFEGRIFSYAPPGLRVLVIFFALVGVYMILIIIRYWDSIRTNEDLIFYGGGLFLAMTFGMFVRVMARNHQEGRPFFDVEASDLIYPLLFSLIVYYPIWALAADAPKGLFPIHAAFLNGYFWESIVSSARAPSDAASRKGGTTHPEKPTP